MSRQTAHAAYSSGKNGFFNTESIQVTPGPVLLSQKQNLTDTKVDVGEASWVPANAKNAQLALSD